MKEKRSKEQTYKPPSVTQLGTVFDLTAGGEVGGSGDTYDCSASVMPDGKNPDQCSDDFPPGL
jgi:hypothetical protein